MKNLNLARSLVFFDLETTSSNVQNARIVQYAFIKIFPNPEEPRQVLSGLVNPGIPIPAEATAIHGITDEMVKDAPSFKDLVTPSELTALPAFIDQCDFAGFNILNYDLPVLKNEFQRADMLFDYSKSKVIDVMALFHHFNPRDLSAACLQYCGKALEGAHGAMADTQATIEVLDRMLRYNLPAIKLTVDEVEAITFDQEKYLGREKKFYWNEKGEACFAFGKIKDMSLQDAARIKPDYLRWILSGGFSSEIKEIVKSALRNEFPKKGE